MNPYIEKSKGLGFSFELHAVRGIAAVLVLLVHIQDKILEAFPNIELPPYFNGSAGVVYFFVLSGLVVGMSLSKSWGKEHFILSYTLRRFFRIMPLMIVMTTIGGIYLLTLNSSMPYSLYRREYGDFSILKMISGYVGYSMKANPPSWSIYVELIASVLIPLLIFCGNKKTWFVASFIFFLLLPLLHLDTQHQWHTRMITFYSGLTILLWGGYLCEKLRKLSNGLFWSLVLIIFMAGYLPRIVLHIDFYGNPWVVYWETFFVSIMVAVIFYMPERFSLLLKKVFQFCGDVSYGLYLTHVILINALFNVLALTVGINGISIVAFILLSIGLSFPLAVLVYKFIELPGIELGKKVSLRVLGQARRFKTKLQEK
ncbi:MAG: acyltransferase [Pseudobdellovibrionaceae bacterium]|nr:acyltransferase [Pseudobdellovibrionaceae bacterium]